MRQDETESDTKNNGVDAVDRALSLLACYGEEDRGLSLAELARRSGFYKSTILRLAASLERFGYLIRGEDGLYRLGPTLWRLGSAYRRHFDLDGLIRPELKNLVEKTGESASLYIREGDSRVCLYRENSPKAVRHHLVEGQRLPLNSGASGRVLRAHGGGDAAGDENIRANGHAISLGERDPDVAAVAVPLFGGNGELIGALAVSGLIYRFDETRRAEALHLLKASVERLQLLLGNDM
ncbi:IclR family transcriptional regulator [Stappia sp. F7233]|uniref:IclR family transcriptional regulator n=1 Tax=Stappia albiluteola TaxID=2758565 RepID=A0A839AAB8_9HYPH|nr:IclR family transcriptional regulator [Stappia albiluteola]MBA5775974.1 IclR family transcriptional regulator [Stappia albiluteola]